MDISTTTATDVYVFDFLSSIDHPRALTVWLLYSSKEHDQLVELEWHPSDYLDVASGADSLAATKFLSKATFLSCKYNLREEALKKFFDAENQCRQTNSRIRRYAFNFESTWTLLAKAKVLTESILGEVDAEEFISSCDWGPGATTLIRRRHSCIPTKFSFERRITPLCYDFIASWFRVAFPHWEPDFEPFGASKVVTVPKNAKTDRTIAIEPGLNLWFQKGAGTVIRSRLRSCGVDLREGQSHNQKKCRIAAKFNKLATVDFSSASDTISLALVEELLPSKWVALLSALRSPYGLLDNSLVYFEKFSSMGNGFTFELETLIFYVLAVVCCKALGIRPDVSVYGDDVILPSSAYGMYTTLCADLGFTVNLKKSYSSGYYRESCGSHYWNGADIKPIFQKEPLDGATAKLKAANALRRYAHRRNTFGCDGSYRACWSALARSIGKNTPLISDGYGDSGLVVNFDEARAVVTKAKHGVEGYYTRVWAVLAKEKFFDNKGMLLSKLHSIGKSHDVDNFVANKLREAAGLGNSTPLPGRIRHVKLRMLIPRWVELGPWL